MQADLPRTRPDAAGRRPRCNRARLGRAASRGMTLVELLVSVALSLFIVTALVALYANVSRTNQEMSKTNLLIENGRFAMQLLQDDVEHAGFWGPVDELTATAVPNACLAYGSWPTGAAREPYVTNLLAIPVQGHSDGSPYTACGSALSTVSAQSDVLIVRHASTCIAGSGCESDGDTGPHIQISGCRTGGTPEPAYVIETPSEMAARSPPIRKKDCDAAHPADRRKLVANIYFVAPGANDVPTLMRMSYTNGTFGAAQSLVEGIEAFRVQYGIDDMGSNGLPISATNPPDGNADRYQTCDDTTPCALADLANVVTLKIHILSRNLDPTGGYTDTKEYTLGSVTVPAANDAYKRHVFSTTVRLVNPSSRREIPS